MKSDFLGLQMEGRMREVEEDESLLMKRGSWAMDETFLD